MGFPNTPGLIVLAHYELLSSLSSPPSRHYFTQHWTPSSEGSDSQGRVTERCSGYWDERVEQSSDCAGVVPLPTHSTLLNTLTNSDTGTDYSYSFITTCLGMAPTHLFLLSLASGSTFFAYLSKSFLRMMCITVSPSVSRPVHSRYNISTADPPQLL